MKYSINNYVDALIETLAVSEKNDEVISNLFKLLKKSGDIRHSKKIIEAVHKKLVNSEGGKWITIETARNSASTDELRNKFSEKDYVELKINPELVAGVRITLNEEQELNNSMNKKLKRMFS